MTSVAVETYDPEWTKQFEEEAQTLAEALGGQAVIIHHVGSTAVPGMTARPVIDILVDVRDIEQVDAFNQKLEDLGYTAVGEHGVPGRRFFIKNDAVQGRTHNVYIFPLGHPEIYRMLILRDYLITHSREAEYYGFYKAELIRRFPEDLRSYMQEKAPFIEDTLRRAEIWQNGLGTNINQEKDQADQ